MKLKTAILALVATSLSVSSSQSQITFTGGTITLSGSSPLTVDTAALDVSIDSQLVGTQGIVKTGSGTLTLGSANSYAGDTTIQAGILKLGVSGTLSGSQSIIVGDGGSTDGVLNTTDKTGFTISGTQTLKGIGTVNVGAGKTLVIEGVHAVGNVGTDGGVGSQAVTGHLSYAAHSIFNWDLNANSTGTGFDTVSATGTVAVSDTQSVFNVIFGTSVNLADAFWTPAFPTQSWSMASIFGQSLTDGSSFAGVTSTANPTTQGSFSITGTSLTWTAVPEPSSALAGLLVAAGLLRRRRVA